MHTITGWVTNSAEPDHMPMFMASDLSQHCLQGTICLNTLSYYGISDGLSQDLELLRHIAPAMCFMDVFQYRSLHRSFMFNSLGLALMNV